MDARFRPADVEPTLLLNPGPVNVSARVARALLRGDLCHREPEFAALQAEIRQRLLDLFAPGDEHAAVLLTGSGTAATEAALSSLVGPGEHLLVCRNGVYGERLATIARAHGIDHTLLDTPAWTDPHDPQALARALDADPSIRAVAVVHHETTTGLLNPLRDLAQVCRERGRALIVDAISSLGGEALDVVGWGLDAVVATANKCLRGLPGLSFVLVRRALLERAAAWPARTLYLHLPTYFAEQERGGTPFTPAVQVAYALHEALVELAEEGVMARAGANAALALRLRRGLERLGLPLLLPPALRSSTITTVRLPERWTYERLHDLLRARNFVIYAGQGDLRRQAWRVATMGTLDAADVDAFLAALARALGRSAA